MAANRSDVRSESESVLNRYFADLDIQIQIQIRMLDDYPYSYILNFSYPKIISPSDLFPSQFPNPSTSLTEDSLMEFAQILHCLQWSLLDWTSLLHRIYCGWPKIIRQNTALYMTTVLNIFLKFYPLLLLFTKLAAQFPCLNFWSYFEASFTLSLS